MKVLKNNIKAEIQNFNDDYNIIKIYRDKTIEFYLEKIDYGNLYYICGVYEDIELTKDYIYKAIGIAELDNFWEDKNETLLNENKRLKTLLYNYICYIEAENGMTEIEQAEEMGITSEEYKEITDKT